MTTVFRVVCVYAGIASVHAKLCNGFWYLQLELGRETGVYKYHAVAWYDRQIFVNP